MITRPITRPITSPIARAVTAHSAIWNPRALFAAGEQGVIYDPNDLSTLFQDAAGTTPVTGAGQPVGLMLDKRLGLVRGTSQPLSKAAAWTGSGSGPYTRTVAAFAQLGALVSQGRWYDVSFRVDAITAGTSLTVYRKNAANTVNEVVATHTVSAGNTYRCMVYVFPGTTPNNYDIVIDSSTFAGTISAVEIRELPGNHAFIATAASRPMLRQSPILGAELVTNGTFDTAAGWATTGGTVVSGGVLNTAVGGTATTPIDFENDKSYEVTVTASGTVANIILYGNGKFGIVSTSAGTKKAVVTISTVGGALTDTLSISSGSVGTVDNISVREITGYYTDRNYLETDGSDDWMQTNAIDFTATDKVSVFTGVRKLSDAASAVVVEHGVAGVNATAWTLMAPDGALPNYSLSLRNSTRATITISGRAAPRSSVISGSLSYAGATIQTQVALRENGILPTQGTDGVVVPATMFGSLPLYLFRRGGTSAPFNGYFYGLTIVGRLCADAERNAVERLYAAKTGVVLS